VLETTNRWNRRSRRRVSHEVFCEGLRGEQVGIQSLNGGIVDVKKGFGMSSWVWLSLGRRSMIMDRRVICGGFSTPTMVSKNHCIPTLHDE
jgi:hypothetical protein